MNEGAFRDRPIDCGWCRAELGGMPQVQRKNAHFHEGCWHDCRDTADAENQEYRRKRIEEGKMKCDECGRYKWRIRDTARAFAGWLGLTLALVALLIFGLWLIYKAVSADNKIQYCYVEEDDRIGSAEYRLYGARDWDDDANLGDYDTIPRALEAAQQLGCRINPLTPENPNQ